MHNNTFSMHFMYIYALLHCIDNLAHVHMDTYQQQLLLLLHPPGLFLHIWHILHIQLISLHTSHVSTSLYHISVFAII